MFAFLITLSGSLHFFLWIWIAIRCHFFIHSFVLTHLLCVVTVKYSIFLCVRGQLIWVYTYCSMQLLLKSVKKKKKKIGNYLCFLYIFGFYHFDYDASESGSLRIYPTWNSLNFVNCRLTSSSNLEFLITFFCPFVSFSPCPCCSYFHALNNAPHFS